MEPVISDNQFFEIYESALVLEKSNIYSIFQILGKSKKNIHTNKHFKPGRNITSLENKLLQRFKTDNS